MAFVPLPVAFLYLIIKPTFKEDMGTSPGISWGDSEEPGAARGGACLRGRFRTDLMSHQTTLRERLEPRQLCISVGQDHTLTKLLAYRDLSLLFIPKLPSGTPKMDSGESLDLTVPLSDVAIG